MTAAELAALAEAAAKATTISYPEWERRKLLHAGQKGAYADVTQTQWWKLFDALGKIRLGEPAPPPPLPPPLPPPPSGVFPPSYAQFSDDFASGAPSSRWSWEYANSIRVYPNPGASVVSDDRGGKALRLKVPKGVGGNGILSAAYEGSGNYGRNGQQQKGTCEMRLVPGFSVAAGSYMWVVEWHVTKGITDGNGSVINSCAIGVNPDLTLRVQLSGGDGNGHSYTQYNDTVPLQINRFHRLDWRAIWSPDPATGLFELWLDDRLVLSKRRGTLLRSGSLLDVLVFGLYNYHLPTNVDTSVDFANVAVGVV